jgi:hypothetical protein
MNFKVGDKIRYKNYHNIKGTITSVTPIDYLINDTLIAKPDEIELDVEIFIDSHPYLYAEEPADTKYRCTCDLRDLMMKGCTKHK